MSKLAFERTHFDHEDEHLEEVYQYVSCPAVLKRTGVPLKAHSVTGIYPKMGTKKQPLDQRIFTVTGPKDKARITIWYTDLDTQTWKLLYVDFPDLTRFILTRGEDDKNGNAIPV